MKSSNKKITESLELIETTGWEKDMTGRNGKCWSRYTSCSGWITVEVVVEKAELRLELTSVNMIVQIVTVLKIN